MMGTRQKCGNMDYDIITNWRRVIQWNRPSEIHKAKTIMSRRRRKGKETSVEIKKLIEEALEEHERH